MDPNYEHYSTNAGLTSFNNNDTQNLNFTFTSNEDLTHLGKLKNEIRENLEFLEGRLRTEPATDQEWQSVINLKNSLKTKLNSANSELTQLLKQCSMNDNSVKYVQIQRYSSIFDQLTSEFSATAKQLESKYQRFLLFNSPNTYYAEGERAGKAFHSGKAVVEAIRDVESLEDQAKLNLEMIKRGNKKLAKIYNRVNAMVSRHLFDVAKLQKNIAIVLTRNRAIFALILGIFVFFVLCKIFSKIF